MWEDHVRLARFKTSEGAEVYVNAALVTYIRAYTDDLTTINFGDNHSVTVAMGVSAAASTLANAEKL